MAANLFDTYSPTEYLPRPFDAYQKVGEAQEGAYNKAQDQIQQAQDAFASYKVRPVDEASKNQFLSEAQQKIMDFYDKHKTYTPDMQGEVRSVIRNLARDPRINNWGAALQNFNERREIEKNLAAQGLPALVSHNDPLNKPVYDQQGNMLYNPSTGDLGVERRLDYTKAARELTAPLKPFESVSKGVGQNVDINVNGTHISIPQLHQVASVLLQKSDPRVVQQITNLAPAFLDTQEGAQFVKHFATNSDGSVNYPAVVKLLTSTVIEQNSVKSLDTPLPGLATIMKASGAGKTEAVTAQSPFLSSAYNFTNLGQKPSDGPIVNTPVRNINTTSFKDLTPDERKELSALSLERFQDYKKEITSRGGGLARSYEEQLKEYNKEVEKIDEANKTISFGKLKYPIKPNKEFIEKYPGKDISYKDFMEEQGSVESNPYGSILTDYLKSKQTKSQVDPGLGVQYISPEQSFGEFANKKTNALTNANTILLAAGTNSLQPMGNVLNGADIKNYHIEYAGHNAVVPTIQGGTQKMAIYRVYLPKDKLENMSLTPEVLQSALSERRVSDEAGKSKASYPVTVAVPMKNITSWQDAKEFDYKQYGPDKQIASDQDYQATHTYHTNLDTFDEYGYKYEPINDGGKIAYKIIAPNGKSIIATQDHLSQQGTAEYVINYLQNAR